jgi:hypothetical protein
MAFATPPPNVTPTPSLPRSCVWSPCSMGNVEHALVASMASTMASTMSAAENTMAAINSVIAHSQGGVGGGGGSSAIDVLMSMEDLSPHYDPSHNFSRCPVPTCKHPGWSGKNRKVVVVLATSFLVIVVKRSGPLSVHCFSPNINCTILKIPSRNITALTRTRTRTRTLPLTLTRTRTRTRTLMV